MNRNRVKVITRFGLLVVAGALATCTRADNPVASHDPVDLSLTTSYNTVEDGGLTPGVVTLCKYGPLGMSADFEVTATGGTVPGNGKFTLDAVPTLTPGTHCADVWTAKGDGVETVTITENVKPGQRLWAIRVNGVMYTNLTGTSWDIEASSLEGAVVFFKNEEEPIDMAPGRMTGGGGQITLGDVHVTRGFTIHCDITLSNNVEINWPDNKWHLDKPLTSALCVDDPDIHPEPPPAPFDTFYGEGIGRLNGVDGSFLRFMFIDSGEPGGKADYARIEIWAPGADPAVDAPVLYVDGVLDHGNIQAHYDQPHK